MNRPVPMRADRMLGALSTVARYLAAAIVYLIAFVALPVRAQQPVVEIHIDNFTFSPAEVTIPAGTTVKWLNRDDIPHTVTEKQLSFRSKALDTDDSFDHQFTQPGVVDYFCSLHPHMTGRIVVVAPGG